jgi:hypothetical protein
VAAGQEEIAGVAGADLNLVAFAAETFDGLEEEDFVMSHGMRIGSRSGAA